MRRILLNYLLPLLLPLVVYGIWLALARRKARLAGAAEVPGWGNAPWTWLLVAGIGLVSVGLVTLALVGDGPTGGTYVPPQFIDGEIVPGRME